MAKKATKAKAPATTQPIPIPSEAQHACRVALAHLKRHATAGGKPVEAAIKAIEALV